MSKIIWLKNNIDINKWNFILIVCLTLFSSVIIPMPSLILKKIIDGGFNNVFKVFSCRNIVSLFQKS